MAAAQAVGIDGGRVKRAAVLGFALFTWGAAALGQDLVITNARILDASTDIARGSIVIDDGRIVSVAAGAVANTNNTKLPKEGRRSCSTLINS